MARKIWLVCMLALAATFAASGADAQSCRKLCQNEFDRASDGCGTLTMDNAPTHTACLNRATSKLQACGQACNSSTTRPATPPATTSNPGSTGTPQQPRQQPSPPTRQSGAPQAAECPPDKPKKGDSWAAGVANIKRGCDCKHGRTSENRPENTAYCSYADGTGASWWLRPDGEWQGGTR